MLVGLLPPTSGDALVFGKNIITDMVVSLFFIGYFVSYLFSLYFLYHIMHMIFSQNDGQGPFAEKVWLTIFFPPFYQSKSQQFDTQL